MAPEVFDEWNSLKKRLEHRYREQLICEGEIYFAYVGQNIGYEISGEAPMFERPVIILKSFGSTFMGIALTSKQHRGPYYHAFDFYGMTSIANLSQTRLFDTKRLGKRLGTMSTKDFLTLKYKLKRILNL